VEDNGILQQWSLWRDMKTRNLSSLKEMIPYLDSIQLLDRGFLLLW
jgi:hypothetical protein